ncbi:hypothetical protein SpiGrapes_2458 [Sphaerochaeta pleomorpha str. Grapes]|uniref:Uncharacterized protein n=1 Tax=Sphaerochaeta pleomorpha (strain ATCC BAA-1885 / DSM 22778 / Grapes) TaxID=158190 RepID=G8QTI0_SPHPG|nr:hypothetical protein [Sphaerochaeta pleomorpha]AEV30221.1 hypothetical protein SpiGrapes_2458 [Sphaerochaeta pleomorpha str. Grapes]
MAESSEHMKYVDILFSFVETLIPKEMGSLILVDKPSCREKPPRTSGNFTPDIIYKNQEVLIIGEAKTEDDVERRHSLSQYENYYLDAINFEGKSIVILSVPWFMKNTIKNVMRRIKQRYIRKIPVFVITELGGAEEI